MDLVIDADSLLAPISGASPSGEYLCYTPVYDEIRQARRSDDPAYAGDGEAKDSEWEKVLSLCRLALTERSKDLLIAAWLTEALVMREGFGGLALGLSVLEGLVEGFWESVYPLVEDEDYDGRAAPFEFLNNKISICVKQIPLTDPKNTAGYGLLKYRESRRVGYEGEGRNEHREALMADGKISADQFDLAVNKTPVSFYRILADTLSGSVEAFQKLETAVDSKFGQHAPGLSELGEALEECRRLVLKIAQEQKGLAAVADAGATEAQAEPSAAAPAGQTTRTAPTSPTGPTGPTEAQATPADAPEDQVWGEALMVLQGGRFREALELLLAAATRQPSERGRNRYRLLVAKLCLRGGRPELARPILEQLNALVTELQLERWESPFWICEILEALHQCLVTAEDADEEAARARELFRKICTLDVTKALK